MMKIALKVSYSDGREQKVTATAPDILAFERTYDLPMTTITSGRMEYIWWITWHASKRLSLTSLEFEAWIETIDSVTDAEDAAEIVPLESSQLTG